MKTTLAPVEYVRNQVLKSPLGNYYFVPKARVLPGGMLEVIGKKHDVTESIEALLAQPRKRKAK